MTTKKKLEQLTDPLRWYEGMPIGPQHLQDAFLRNEELLRYRVSLLSPYFYGVVNLKIDKEMLKFNVFKIQELECLMPDGLEIGYIYGVDKAIEVDLSSFQAKIQNSPFTIFLCVPHGKQISHTASKFARFRALQAEMVPDMNLNGESIGIPRYRPNVSLIVSLIPPSEYVSLPIAKIGFDNQACELLPYIAPSLIVEAGNELLNICASLTNILRSKLDFLTNQYKKSFDHNSSSTSHILSLINTIREVLPQCDLIANIPYISPFDLYSKLASIYGKVTSLDKSFLKEFIPRYVHENLLSVFSELSHMILRHLELEIPKEYIVQYFNRFEHYFSAVLDEESIKQDSLILGFRKNPLFSENEFVSLIQNLLICETSKFESFRESRSLGLERKQVYLQNDLLLNRNIYFFSVDIKNCKYTEELEVSVFSNTELFKSLEKNSIMLYKKAN